MDMNLSEMKQTIRVAKMYYEVGMSQEEIAEKELISKSTVSRLIKKAWDNGFVKVTVNYPIQAVEELEEEFKSVFNLKKLFLAPVLVDNNELIKNDVCKALGLDLAKLVKDDDIIGVSWGNTMECVSLNLSKTNKRGIKIVQLNGGVAKNIKPSKSTTIIENFTQAFDGIGYILPVPAIVDNKNIAEVLISDTQIKQVFELIKNCRIVVFGIGHISLESVLFEAGYFSQKEYRDLQLMGAVGDICSRYFDINGKVVDQVLDKRTMGVTLEALRDKEFSIGIAVGEHKAEAVLGALQTGYINSLYTDEKTARAILNIHYQSSK